jgi:undecaprenyl pyrophosphate phosphatase UppP
MHRKQEYPIKEVIQLPLSKLSTHKSNRSQWKHIQSRVSVRITYIIIFLVGVVCSDYSEEDMVKQTPILWTVVIIMGVANCLGIEGV